MRVALRVTRYNRCSLPALAAVLETELRPGTVDCRTVPGIAELNASDLVVYSFSSGEVESVADEMRTLRKRVGDRLFAIAGGPHPSARPDQVLDMGFRWAAVGEAGPGFAGLVAELAAGTVPAGGVIRESTLDDLDRYPPWPRTGKLFAPIEISRGCPVGCAFCQTPTLFGKRMRHRSPSAIGPALRRAVETGNTYTRFVTPNAFAYGSADGRTPHPRRVEELLVTARASGMQRVFFGTFPSEVRPESVTAELLGIVRDHCDNKSIAIGMQSGSPRLLQAIRRGHTVQQAVAAVEAIAHAGFRPRVDFILGLPGETDDDRAKTREVVRRLVESFDARIHAHLFVPLPGTPLAGQSPSEIDPQSRAMIEELTGRGYVAGVKRRGRWTRLDQDDED
ncbi:MAG: TIGR04013 family B12-binding domain/radical SAM domain-containing protein [Deltaproteobacteria bacterium]|nr:TIGR04013 family B12-binding domain/radical SAM domain-containing protein [Deltaproteobacteria bacterium]